MYHLLVLFIPNLGFAMSKGCNNSGLSTWMAEQLRYMAIFEAWQINLMISIVAAIVTEFVSNTATANILVPILRELSISLCRNPIHLGKFLFFIFTLDISPNCNQTSCS